MATPTLNAHDEYANGPSLGDLEINGMRPFISARLASRSILDSVHGALIVLQAAQDLADDVGERSKCMSTGLEFENSVDTLRDVFMARTFEALAQLVALAAHCDEVANANDARQRMLNRKAA